ncbi:MAG: hypothetical protein U1A77_13285 [Pirellulales bacterium]
MSSRNRGRAIISVVLLAHAGALMLGRPQATAYAQQPAGQMPTTVQLPTFHQFSLQTSVVAPDRGSMVLGGVNRAASGSSSTGIPGLSHLPGASRLFRNRAIGSESSSTQASVSVWVHDLKAMDEAILAEAAARRNASSQSTSSPSPRTAGSFPLSSSSPATQADSPAGLRAIRAQQRAEDQQREEEARELLAQGEKAELEGKPGVARLFYQMAARRSPATMSAAVQSRLRLLTATKTR